METAIIINVSDRPTELAMLLESLKYQTYKNFDIYILDDCSGTPLNVYHFLNCIITRLKLEAHKIFIKRTDFKHGVSRARQVIVDWAMEGDYEYFVRVDDDVILEADYLEKLIHLSKTYDICSGVTVPMAGPTLKRDPKYLKGIVNRVIFDDKGKMIMNGDSCGCEYTDRAILLADHFRSCALIKRSVHEKVKYYPTKLSKHGFREENIFSFNAIIEGFTIGVDTSAVTWHMQTPSGGERPTTNMTPFNQEIFEEFTKKMFEKHGDFIKEYHKKNGIEEEEMSDLELLKEDNLITRK